MKKDLNRALNTFAAMDALPEGMLVEAEDALIAAEGGLPSAKKPPNGFLRFLNSGWGAAVISGIVALGVLAFVIRAGQAPDTYEPPVKPAGSTIEMSDHGADFTISTEQANYDDGVLKITAVMTAKVAGKSISSYGSWRLEKLTADGAEIVPTYHTEEVIVSGKPPRKEYATIKKTIHVDGTPLTAGTYRLHATEYDGEKYVSVAYCTFTVGDPTDQTQGGDTEYEDNSFVIVFPPAADRPYAVTTADSIEYGATGLGITVKATEQGVPLMPHRNYRIVKLAGPANGDGAVWIQTAEAVEVMPTEENGGYAVFKDSVTFMNPNQWLPGLYRLYALNHNEEYIDYCDFVIQPGDSGLSFRLSMEQVRYTEEDTKLAILFEAYEPGRPISRGDCWTLYRMEGGERIYMGSQAAEYALEGAEIAPDEYAVEHYRPSVSLVTGGKYKTLPAGQYELVFEAGGAASSVSLYFEVTAVALTTDDPDKTVAQGTFFWANGHPFVNLTSWGSDVYPVSFTIKNDSIDCRQLTTGDTVEIIMDAWVAETFPCQGTLYELRKDSDGEMTDLPAAMVQAMEEMGYVITDTSN